MPVVVLKMRKLHDTDLDMISWHLKEIWWCLMNQGTRAYWDSLSVFIKGWNCKIMHCIMFIRFFVSQFFEGLCQCVMCRPPMNIMSLKGSFCSHSNKLTFRTSAWLVVPGTLLIIMGCRRERKAWLLFREAKYCILSSVSFWTFPA